MGALRSLHAALLLIAAAAIAGPVWMVASVNRPIPIADTANRTSLESMASRACECARLRTDKAGKAACWREFDAETGNRRAKPMVTFCSPVSQISFQQPDGSWLIASWGILGRSEDAFCTTQEAAVAEAQFVSAVSGADALPPEQQREIEARATDALEQLSSAYARGDRAEAPQNEGCAG